MLRFFRSLRQKLLAENRFRNYFLYALGEILLVVLGILIALQVNNWNEERKHAGEVRQALISLQNEIEDNIRYLEGRVARLETDLDALETWVGTLNTQEPEKITDSLIREMMGSIGPLELIPLRHNAYNNLINSGTINHVRDDSLKLNLIDIERGYQLFEGKQNLINTNWETMLKPFYLDHGDLPGIRDTLHRKAAPPRGYPLDRQAFINNRKFSNILTQRIFAELTTQRDFEIISRRLAAISAHVQAYLDRH